MRYFIFLIISFLLMGSNAGICAVSTLLADTKNGVILSSQNANKQQYPASLTKVMTLYLTFNALENGLLKMDDALPISLHAAKQPASKMYLKAGDTIRVRDAINALIIKSANDVAVVLAEALAPSEADFAKMMTETARKLGMKNTVFRNASGLHHPNQVTTAQDMAILTIAVINHFPQYYKLFSKNEFFYRGKLYKTHNHVTKNYKGAEGLKTGYVAAVGYNIISTAKRNNDRFVTVVIGHKSSAERDRQAVRLLDKGFSMAKNQKSVLKRLQQGGKKLNTQAVKAEPNLNPQLKVMEKRLAQIKKVSNSIQSVQFAKVQKSKQLDERTLPALVALDEIEQGSASDSPNNILEQSVALAEAKNEVSEMIAQQETSTQKAKKVRTFSADNPVLALSDSNQNSVYQAISADELTALSQEKEPSAFLNESTKQTQPIVDKIVQNQKDKENLLDETVLAFNEQNKIVSENLTEENLAQNEENSIKDVMQMRKSSWGVQVGAFSKKAAAENQASKALKIVSGQDKFVKVIRTDKFYRSRIYGFKTKKSANLACRRLKTKNFNCMTLSPTLSYRD